MFIKDIDAILEPSVNLLDNSAVDVIDTIVELPLRKACKIFRDKGIETVMSSANKTNIVSSDRIIEKENIGRNPFETHMFYDAGKGYAWIMLNFNTLSSENKELLFDLEETIDEKGNAVGEKLVWFVHPFEMQGNIEYGLRIGKFDYDYLRMCLSDDDIPVGIEVDESLIEFEKRHVTLLYPWTDSSSEAVFLRMPINESTSVLEVEEYFVNLAESFHNQKKMNNRVGKK